MATEAAWNIGREAEKNLQKFGGRGMTELIEQIGESWLMTYHWRAFQHESSKRVIREYKTQ
jgi:hypothetical protein